MAASSSPFHHRIRCLFLLVFIYGMAIESTCFAGRIEIRIGNMRLGQNVQSMHELRWKNLTRQGWDISCGAAALSTLLTYHQKKKFSEMAITLTILKNSDPALVRERGGFSLYDLKRFVQAIGLEGLGYGDMTVDDLELFDLPAILPIRMGDFDHFVVFRKRLGNHIFLGDSAFGNVSVPEKRFVHMWKSRVAFYVVTSEEKDVMSRHEKAGKRSPLTAESMEMAIPDSGYVNRILHRMPIVPVTRRMTIVAP